MRVVLCSTSFSMGINIRDVQLVVHYGPASDMDSYLQETGRAGRHPDVSCHAVIILYKHSTGSTNIKPEMKEYVKTKDCRREFLLGPYMDGSPILKPEPLHKCCDCCALLCDCGNCESAKMPVYIQEIDSDCEDSSSTTSSSDVDSDSDIEYFHRKPVLPLSESEED